MQNRIALAFLLVSICLPQRAEGQDFDPALVEWIETVGKMIHSYHEAHRVASAAVMHYGEGEIPPLYAGGPVDGGWAFSFGDMEADSVFVLDYGVMVAEDGSISRMEVFEYRRVASVHHTLAARALRVVMEDFEAYRLEEDFNAPAYRFSVLPFPQSGLTAFVSPDQTVPGMTLFGNSLMYRLDRGSAIIQARNRFHHRIMPMPTPQPDGVMGILMVPQAPMPTPVDVQNTIEMQGPMVVQTENGIFLISPNGDVELMDEDDPAVRSLLESIEDVEQDSVQVIPQSDI